MLLWQNLQLEPLYRYEPFGKEFYRIGGRCQAHSVILRQNGIRKIYDFLSQKGIFMPYDVEISFVPSIELYNLKREIVWSGDLSNSSDTDLRHFS